MACMLFLKKITHQQCDVHFYGDILHIFEFVRGYFVSRIMMKSSWK